MFQLVFFSILFTEKNPFIPTQSSFAYFSVKEGLENVIVLQNKTTSTTYNHYSLNHYLQTGLLSNTDGYYSIIILTCKPEL